MNCKKYVITNTGNKITTFNYRRCDEGLPEKLTEYLKIKVDVFCYDDEARGILIP
jgi:hypothetical protein